MKANSIPRSYEVSYSYEVFFFFSGEIFRPTRVLSNGNSLSLVKNLIYLDNLVFSQIIQKILKLELSVSFHILMGKKYENIINTIVFL